MGKKYFLLNQFAFLHVALHLMLATPCRAQDTPGLRVGDNAPNLVLSSTNNSIQSFNFPYQNKMVLLFFWSSSVSKSKENLYKYKKLYSKYSDIGFKTSDGFDVISVALQSDKIAWTQDLVKYDLLKFNNCIAQKGYNDLFVKNYKIKETTNSFLIDELGKIVAINPDLKTLITYLDEKRNLELNPEPQSRIKGKVMFGQGTLAAVPNEGIWFIKGTDTLQHITLDEKGGFILEHINPQSSLKIYMKATPNIADEVPVFLTTESGDIISPFSKTEHGYEYLLLDAEIPYLRPHSDFGSRPEGDKSLKNLNRTENLFKSKEVVLSPEAITKLTRIVALLKENPKTRLEVITHTDSKDATEKNQSLSLKQSNAVTLFFSSKGIPKTRLKAIGKGETEILNKCKEGTECLEQEHAQNRRTEFKFYLPD
ncbi:MAG: hypothetical protein K0R26_2137 [Bacteroidota bacterium]|jgi:flagellar motor protein MotB|nr:hypothetical protein [Bacteroidota bacterium]